MSRRGSMWPWLVAGGALTAAWVVWRRSQTPYYPDVALHAGLELLSRPRRVLAIGPHPDDLECFVGGTLDDTGGHNLLEPALFGRPAVFGPNYRNARHAGDTLLKMKGGFLAEAAPQLAGTLCLLLTDPAAMQAARANSVKTLAALRGATARTIAAITR